MDNLPTEIHLLIAESLREGPRVLQPHRDDVRAVSTMAWERLDWNSCLKWNTKLPKFWDAVFQTVQDLLNLSLVNRKYYAIASPIMNKILALVLKCIKPPWVEVKKARERQVRTLARYLDGITNLGRNFRRWAVRVTAPANGYRLKSFTGHGRVSSYNLWAERLMNNRFYMPKRRVYGSSTHVMPSLDTSPTAPGRHSRLIDPEQSCYDEPAGLLYMLRSLNNDIIDYKYITSTDEYEIIVHDRPVKRALVEHEGQQHQGHRIYSPVSIEDRAPQERE
ncbi:uncharacterized protein KY384_000784 [Bacidia gigantensis]|uniref:uncharacterized protein n=1 Tax=Bacidia gigantensis TaxID=2732470 RepID=UPI001D058BDF|nr:uncharacterized protein KY384_000784 [Bacidia gigantensis]KAG8526022.1 hypothetical protein KY384_000784 [Bacidia gigantensis]